MLKISYKENTKCGGTTENEKETTAFLQCYYKTNMAFAGHVLQGSSGDSTLTLFEGKRDGKKVQGRLRQMWIDDKQLDSFEKIKRVAEDRLKWRAVPCQRSVTEDG